MELQACELKPLMQEAILEVYPAKKTVFAAIWNVSRGNMVPLMSQASHDLSAAE
jgi:hypothetical protein